MKASAPDPASTRARLALAVALACAAAGCLVPAERTSGRGSEVENEVYGVMVDVSGKTVAGARVLAFSADPATTAPGAALDSAVTGKEGVYRLQALQPGAYNLLGDYEDGNLSVLIPDVRYAPGPALDLGTDTLLAPGAIEGRVRLGNAGKPGVMAYIPGTSFLAVTDANGAFSLPAVPKGVYRVNYRLTGYSGSPDTGVPVESGSVTRLPDKILAYDTTQSPPPPDAVGAVLDTLRGLVRLQWSSVAIGDLLGYKVYRDEDPLSLPVAVSGIVMDTQFVDTLRDFAPAGAPARDLGYRVRTVDRQLNEGVEYSPSVRLEAVSPALATTTLTLSAETPLRNRTGMGRPVRVRLAFSNPTRRVMQIEWLLDGVSAGLREPGARSGVDSLTLVWSQPALHTVSVKATDEGDDVWTASTEITVIVDAPVANAGKDTTVSIGDRVELRPTATDQLGTIARWEWEIGGAGLFREAPGGSLDFQAPLTPMDAYPCILKVTDDEGHTGFDTLSVRVLADPPNARLEQWPLEAFPGDTVTLSAAGSSDRFGRIVSWEWDIGKRGTFVAGAGHTYRFIGRPDADSILTCVLRVTDDDGQSDTSETRILFRTGDEWALWSKDGPMREMHFFHCWAFGGKLWLLGDHNPDLLGPAISLWSTSDMVRWDRSEAKALSEIDLYVRPVVHDGAMWLAASRPFGLWRTTDGSAWDHFPGPPEMDTGRSKLLASHAGYLWAFFFRDTLAAEGWTPNRSEIWNSPDGATWTLVSDRAPYGIREVTAAVSWNDLLWIYGDSRVNHGQKGNDVWSSADGMAWRPEATGIFPSQRQAVFMFARQDALWMIAEQNNSVVWGEIMRSGDGAGWSPIQAQGLYVPGHGIARAAVFGERIWLLLSSDDGIKEMQAEIRRGPW